MTMPVHHPHPQATIFDPATGCLGGPLATLSVYTPPPYIEQNESFRIADEVQRVRKAVQRQGLEIVSAAKVQRCMLNSYDPEYAYLSPTIPHPTPWFLERRIHSFVVKGLEFERGSANYTCLDVASYGCTHIDKNNLGSVYQAALNVLGTNKPLPAQWERIEYCPDLNELRFSLRFQNERLIHVSSGPSGIIKCYEERQS